MQPGHFAAIIKAIEASRQGGGYHLRVSLRNREVYEGPWRTLDGVPDIIVIDGGVAEKGQPVFIALPALATVSAVA